MWMGVCRIVHLYHSAIFLVHVNYGSLVQTTHAPHYQIHRQCEWLGGLPRSYFQIGENLMTARMKDVAAYAGVSIATVSYVVNKKPQKTISDETTVRVINAARALDYKINEDAQRLAQRLAQQRTRRPDLKRD